MGLVFGCSAFGRGDWLTVSLVQTPKEVVLREPVLTNEALGLGAGEQLELHETADTKRPGCL